MPAIALSESKGNQVSAIALNESSRRGVVKLIAHSHEKLMDLSSVLPWDQGVDKSMRPKPADQCWLAGTPYIEMLTDEQKHEHLWQENARDVSQFITIEQMLPPLYMGYVNKHGDALSSDVHEYLMLFSKEEIVHTLMFRRYMKLAGLKLFRPADGVAQLLAVQLPNMPPECGVAVTLGIEWMAELAAMHASQSDEIEPMTRRMFYEHHVEESRHIAFGRWVTESYLETATEAQAQQIRGVLRMLMTRLFAQFTFNAEITEHVSFKYPFAPDDEAKISEVRNSPANVALNAKRFAPMNNWLRKLEVM